MPSLYHSFDAEASCRNIVNGGLMSLGMSICLVDEKTNEVIQELKRFTVNIEWGVPLITDEVTQRMWNKHKIAYTTNRTNAVDPWTAAMMLQNEITTTRVIAAKNKWNYKIIVDNPAFDLLWFDFFMSQFCPNFLPIRHHHLNGYIGDNNVIDVAQRKRALMDLGIDLRLHDFKSVTQHDHTPGNDARHTVDDYLHYRRVVGATRLKIKQFQK